MVINRVGRNVVGAGGVGGGGVCCDWLAWFLSRLFLFSSFACLSLDLGVGPTADFFPFFSYAVFF